MALNGKLIPKRPNSSRSGDIYVVFDHRPDYGYRSVVAVFPKWRSKGVASALIGEAKDFLLAQKKCTILIDVEQNNDGAIKAYQVCGAKIIDSFKD
jgi:ribosomal protein S18 acetylase RimI-like enzyme